MSRADDPSYFNAERVRALLAKDWFENLMYLTGKPGELDQFNVEVRRLADAVFALVRNERPDLTMAVLCLLLGEHLLTAAGLANQYEDEALREMVKQAQATLSNMKEQADDLLALGRRKGGEKC